MRSRTESRTRPSSPVWCPPHPRCLESGACALRAGSLSLRRQATVAPLALQGIRIPWLPWQAQGGLFRLPLRLQRRRASRPNRSPDFLLPAREIAARFARLDPAAMQHAHLIEYRPGASIGWHKDQRTRRRGRPLAALTLQVPGFVGKRATNGSGASGPPNRAPSTSCAVRRGTIGSASRRCRPRYSITFRSLADRGRRSPSAQGKSEMAIGPN